MNAAFPYFEIKRVIKMVHFTCIFNHITDVFFICKKSTCNAIPKQHQEYLLVQNASSAWQNHTKLKLTNFWHCFTLTLRWPWLFSKLWLNILTQVFKSVISTLLCKKQHFGTMTHCIFDQVLAWLVSNIHCLSTWNTKKDYMLVLSHPITDLSVH